MSLRVAVPLVAIVLYFLYIPVPMTIERPLQVYSILLRERVWGMAAAVQRVVDGETLVEQFRRAQVIEPADLTAVKVEDLHLAGVPTRSYTPTTWDSSRPLVLFIHGGGWVRGAAALHDGFIADLARDTRSRILSPDYRLSPEHLFPAAEDDCIGAARGALNLFGDSQLVVMGDGAGGHLALVVTQQLARDPVYSDRLIGQLAVSPYTQMVELDLPSHSLYGFWSPADFYLLHLLGEQDSEEATLVRSNLILSHNYSSTLRHTFFNLPARPKYEVSATTFSATALDPRASPLLTSDLTLQPPALIVLYEASALRDDGQLYADRLKAAGVDTSVLVIPSVHTGPPRGKAYAFAVQWLRTIFKLQFYRS